MSDPKQKTFNIKKCKKREAKKRKLEAFLNLVREDSLTHVNEKKKPPRSFSESYKALQDELRKYQKKKVDPLFYLTDRGRSAKVKTFIKNEKLICSTPLFVEDIYHLLLKSVLGHVSPFPIYWAKLEQPNCIAKTVLIEIEGLCEENIIEMNSAFNDNFSLPCIVKVVSSDTVFATELSTLHLVNDIHSQAKRNYSSMFPVDQLSIVKPEEKNQQNNVSKLHLLLSPIQLAMEHYPLSQSIFEESKSDGYCFSKDTYTPVCADSPMFAVDCEMCRTVTGKQEVTRIAIVNENLEIIYHTLVKPKAEIIDYVTRFSGITEKMLRDVKTTLSDVQRDIRNLLPSDAILCGQSLNCDLHGLKMIHPYVIDTSVIYNEYGIRQKKTSLKQLSQIHLKESIQDSKKGHNPIEDSVATMKLVQLKLKNSVHYGDAVLFSDNVENNTNSSEIENNCTMSVSRDVSKFENLNSAPKDGGFFSIISRFSKKLCLIGNEKSLGNYCQEMITDNVTQVVKSNVKNILKATIENSESSDLIISHLVLDPDNSSVIQLNNEIKEMHDSLPSKTLFIILMSAVSKSTVQCFRHNFCMITLKS